MVLGTLTITSEYSTGMIRTSLTVMPRRGILFAAKAAVFTAVALVVALRASFAAFFLGQALLTQHARGRDAVPAGRAASVLGPAVFVALCGLFAFGLGAILRSTAGAITAAFGLLFLVPQLARALPGTWYADLVRWLPGGDVVGRDHRHRESGQPAAPVLRVGRVRGVRRLHGDPAHRRRGRCSAAATPSTQDPTLGRCWHR